MYFSFRSLCSSSILPLFKCSFAILNGGVSGSEEEKRVELVAVLLVLSCLLYFSFYKKQTGWGHINLN
jgi:hypothetical protein